MSELRYNYLMDTWVIVAPERERRPHEYSVHPYPSKTEPTRCPFEPGKESLTPHEIYAIREPGTQPDSPGWKVRVVPNRYPALRIENSTQRKGICIYDTVGGFGAHEVVIDTPDHFKHLHNFSVEEMRNLLFVFRERMRSLYGDRRIKYVLIFKNYGREAGASLTHSHSQIIALPQIPRNVETAIEQSRRYYSEKGRCYLCDEIRFELDETLRVIYENELFVAYCPFSSAFPFEVRVAPKEHHSDFSKIDDEGLYLLSDILRFVFKKLYKALVNPSYNLFIHTSPPKRPYPERSNYFVGMESFFHWYIEILPRITVLAGFELGGGYFINPTTPETAAKFLREVLL
ncbi:MAG: galactose-1-phosphate uridylyltransferase [Nitrospiraceae bacterium]|nr:galactose-1-phosphate uridylyltransferase [Nitrospiraceae bacterium]